MAEIIKKLNLNKHPKDVVNNSLVDAINIMISKDGTTLQTECGIDVFDTINIFLNNYFYNLYNEKQWEISNYNKYNIIHCCPCNKELLLFIKILDNPNDLYIFRYNEDENKIKYITNTNYNNGELLTTFTYNKNKLILAIAENNSEEQTPLKIINIGNFNDTITEENNPEIFNYKYHPICPEVKIPKININIIDGNSYKGWYYIFIRYKISNDNYTKWFNTNESIYITDFIESKFIDYYISKELNDNINFNGYATNIVSSNSDISNITFKCILNDLYTEYNNYQLSFVCINKSYTKVFKSSDININNNEYLFNIKYLNNYNLSEILINNYNYYDIKSLDSYNNRLYIANYKENKINTDFKDITLDISLVKSDISLINEKEIIENSYTINYENNDFIIETNKIIIDNVEYEYIDFQNAIFKDYYKKIYYNNICSNETTITYNWTYNAVMNDSEGSTISDVVSFSFKAKELKYVRIVGSNNFGVMVFKNNNFKDINEYRPTPPSNLIDISWGGNYLNINDLKLTNVINLLFRDGDISKNNKVINNYLKTNNITILNNLSTLPNNYYNFFIHFVNKYGEESEGFQINKFNVQFELNDFLIKNINNNFLICPKLDFKYEINGDNVIFNKCNLQFKLSKIPNEYIGYFVTYEKLEKSTIYTCVGKIENNNIKLYNNRFNYDDLIDFNFNNIKILNNIDIVDNSNKTTSYSYNYEYNKSLNLYNLQEIKFNNLIKQLLVADTYDNINKSTNIELTLDSNYDNNSYFITLISNDNIKYSNYNKQLIPCSKINYNTDYIEVNTKNCFITKNHATIYNDSYFNTSIKTFQQSNNSTPITNILYNIKWYFWDEILHESINYNNKPNIIFFPYLNISEIGYDMPKTTYKVGFIVEAKNSIDLYKQKQQTYYDLYPKVYTNYKDDIEYITNFNKSIRRSNVIQDESDHIGWRIFESDQYININENKGDIIKITGIGNLMLVHTEHSLFVFNDTNTIKATQSDIQLGNVDIWDIKYKELLSSKLGYAGIKHEKDAIVGSFGYIFYDSDGRSIYKYDNNKLEKIDENINNFLNQYNNINVNFIDDINNDRLLICFNALSIHGHYNKFSLSYNYKINNFISTHDYYFKGYTTKNNTYLLNNNLIYKYIDNNNLDYYTNAYNNYNNSENDRISKISIITNLSYEDIKFLNSIKYKLRNINEPYNTTIEPINGTIENAGDIIRIFSEYCDTGYIDVTKCNNEELFVEKNNGNYNAFNDYKIPVFRLGNWHFNGTKDKFVEYLKGNINYNEMSDIYGNWFVVSFIFNRHKIVEIESIDYKISNDIIK